MKTLAQLIEATKCRRGKSAGITKNGAYWLACEPIEINSTGGDGIGNNAPNTHHYLILRHFRDGAVRPQIKRDAWHQNGAFSGDGVDYMGADHLASCTTIEDIIVALKAIRYRLDISERVYGGDEKPLVEALGALGMPYSMPAPDEV